MPAIAPPASSRSLAMGRVALTVTALSWTAYIVSVVGRELLFPAVRSPRDAIEALVYAALVTLLALSAVSYIVARQGYLRRTRAHVRAPRAEIDTFFEDCERSVTVLIPSYREQPEVIAQTMLSAALQEFPSLRVVLLIDDPPAVTDPEQLRRLEAARAVPGQIAAVLEAPRRRFEESIRAASARARTSLAPSAAELSSVAADYDHGAAYIADLAGRWVAHDHTDDFFARHVLGALADDLSIVAGALRGAVMHRSSVTRERYAQLQRRLLWIFTVETGSFERKRHLTLSAEPNKAMNLNSYIGLMGGSYCEQQTSAGSLLLRCEPDDPTATLHVPRPDYIVTLDADSVLLPEYCLRLVHRIEQPGSERTGVIQTPYSAFPGSPTRVERLAGATTDIQHIVHQGMAEHGAAFWVGANAVLRTDAIWDLRVDDDSEGHVVSRFISDRTVIEDTESTLDLAAKGWTVANYPERLAYSASPPDFGSLCIQRQRWANGGLVILGKLANYWRAKKERGEPRRPTELLLRLNYLASITWATVGLVLLLAYPFSSRLMSVLVVAMSAPYFLVMAGDLHRCGYKRTDVMRVYGFNLVMLPVNASGVVRSIGQIVTGHKVAFARTPKVRHRSAAPALFVVCPYIIVALSAFALDNDIHHHHWPHAVFAGANLALAVPAAVALIGLRYSLVDAWLGFVNLLYKTPRQTAPPPRLDPLVDWAAVLYAGSVDKPRSPHRSVAPTDHTPASAPEFAA